MTKVGCVCFSLALADSVVVVCVCVCGMFMCVSVCVWGVRVCVCVCGVRVCVCVCKAPGDDILIFVNFRLEATVSQSPVVKGKNKRRACTCARVHTRLHSQTLQQSYTQQ